MMQKLSIPWTWASFRPRLYSMTCPLPWLKNALEERNEYVAIYSVVVKRCRSMFSDSRYRMDPANFWDLCALAIQPVLRTPRSFKPRIEKYRQLSLSRKFVICTLSTYPQMLILGKGSPPFLHPQFLGKEPERGF
ncbi:hypothetical protein BJ875DRAFT_452064 [Amylocarpus encephaloides]|uniref:Uncharacterized protein n=1 Tax=Amylocarpus encephaloides TaxID=45428 RepID=A0A9P8C937_9HELO|nr:hypothetical protein BJ875DRAFT_452064 [Amylocarpus encephaloides]